MAWLTKEEELKARLVDCEMMIAQADDDAGTSLGLP